MERIEINEYVRTKDGRIAQIKGIDYEAGIYRFDAVIYINEFGMRSDVIFNNEYFERTIAKHSKNLIDLIKNKDILKIKTDGEILFLGIDENTLDIKYKEIIEDIKNGDYQLLEILTYEQFEQNSYKVGGKDE